MLPAIAMTWLVKALPLCCGGLGAHRRARLFFLVLVAGNAGICLVGTAISRARLGS
jgi:hypothetical protein